MAMGIGGGSGRPRSVSSSTKRLRRRRARRRHILCLGRERFHAIAMLFRRAIVVPLRCGLPLKANKQLVMPSKCNGHTRSTSRGGWYLPPICRASRPSQNKNFRFEIGGKLFHSPKERSFHRMSFSNCSSDLQSQVAHGVWRGKRTADRNIATMMMTTGRGASAARDDHQQSFHQ